MRMIAIVSARRWRPRPRVRRIQLHQADPRRHTGPAGDLDQRDTTGQRAGVGRGLVLLIAGAGLLLARRTWSWRVSNGTVTSRSIRR